jgi:hypothetical protein
MHSITPAAGLALCSCPIGESLHWLNQIISVGAISSLELVHECRNCCSFGFHSISLPFVIPAQILGTGMDTQDTSPSILLFFDKQRFIFNAGEVGSAVIWFL